MKIEIAICTWNRAELLRDTLNSVAQLNIAGHDQLRVIVVDNNSTDHTPQVLQQADPGLNLTWVREPRQGHAHARNRALSEARGELLIWTDDDVRMDRDWLIAYSQASEQWPNCSFFGGPIRPRFVPAAPPWIEQNWSKVKGCFAERDLGPDPILFDAINLPYGANLAVRTDIQKQYEFDTRSGRWQNSVLGDDEIGVLRQMLNAGLTGRWVPSAGLLHMIDRSRQTTAYIRDYFIGQGRSLVRQGRQWSNDPAALKRESRWEAMCARIKRPVADSDVWVSHLIRGALAMGQAIELVNRQQERNTTD